MVFNKQSNDGANSSGSNQAPGFSSSVNGTTGNSSLNDLNKKGSVVQKPQKLFQDKIDNSKLPFLPKIRQKLNALVPLPGRIVNAFFA